MATKSLVNGEIQLRKLGLTDGVVFASVPNITQTIPYDPSNNVVFGANVDISGNLIVRGSSTFDGSGVFTSAIPTITSTQTYNNNNQITTVGYVGGAIDGVLTGNNTWSGTNNYSAYVPTCAIANTPANTTELATVGYVGGAVGSVFTGNNTWSGTNNYSAYVPTCAIAKTPANTTELATVGYVNTQTNIRLEETDGVASINMPNGATRLLIEIKCNSTSPDINGLAHGTNYLFVFSFSITNYGLDRSIVLGSQFGFSNNDTIFGEGEYLFTFSSIPSWTIIPDTTQYFTYSFYLKGADIPTIDDAVIYFLGTISFDGGGLALENFTGQYIKIE